MKATIIIETDSGKTLVYAPPPDELINIEFDTPREFVQYPNYDTGVMTLNVSVRGKTPSGGLWHDSAEAPLVVMQREHARIIFDALAGSLDFGSGFLDDDAVEALRALAVLFGVNPTTATPLEFRNQYAHSASRIGDGGVTRPGPKHDPVTCWDCRT